MPTLCSAYNCKNRCPKAGVGFFSFPKNDPERRKRWIINMKWKDWTPQHHHRVCSDHFEEKYIRRMNKRLHLVPDAVPTIFDFPDNVQKKMASIHPQSKRAGRFLNDELPGKYAAASDVTKPALTQSHNITPESSTLAKDFIAPENVTTSSWYIQVDEEIQMAESLPGFFHSDYCLPHSIRWAFKDDIAPKVACENMDFQLPPLKHTIEITEAWEWLGMDIRGPLPLTPNGHQYILTLTDFYSKWVEAFPLRSCSSMEVAQHVAEVISHFGFPFGILVRLKRKFTSKINLALNSHLKLKGFSLLYRHRQVGSLDLVTQTLISRMVSDLLKDQPENWDVCLPAKVFSLCFHEHPKTKQRPFSLLCCKGPQQVSTPRDLSFSPAELRETSFAIQSSEEGWNDTAMQEMVGIESGKEMSGKATITRITFLRNNTDCNAGSDNYSEAVSDCHAETNPDCLADTNPDCLAETNPDCPAETNPDCPAETNPDCHMEPAPDCLAEAAPDCLAEAAPDCLAEAAPDCLAEAAPDCLAEAAPDCLAEAAPDCLAEAAPDCLAEAAPDCLAEAAPDCHEDDDPHFHPDVGPDGDTDDIVGIESVRIFLLRRNTDSNINPNGGSDGHSNTNSSIEMHSDGEPLSDDNHAMED
ncbi:hypothetical protein DPEC_G00305590 [Dallia pectoralis]|uniref:Uncharacterized protein n=1 Tax=Dallia pectoralis TaxID=75939 RepID=A0ACC2FDT4_DALPE|nr:hypothetical protein DPEC_G00305590 [Dallia pectoralis]